MSSVKTMTGKMRTYFQTTVEHATKGREMKLTKAQKQIASLAGLCKELDISKTELLTMQHGNDDERKFYEDMLLDFEVAADAMYAASMIDAKAYGELKTMFRSSGVESDKNVTVVFPKWNAPDDWEDYEDLKQICDEEGLTFYKLKLLLEKAIKAGLK